jgi:hypothetical protein
MEGGTPCCGLEVQKHTQAHQSVKGPGNTFDLNSKWSRTLPSLIYFSWNIYRDSPPLKKKSNIKVEYIKDGKVLDHFEFKSKVLPGPFTD